MVYRETRFNHVYVIGTERYLLPDCLQSYADEVEFMREILNETVPLLIIDESKPEIQNENRKMVYELKNNNPDALILYFDMEVQKSIFNLLLRSNVPEEIVNLLDFEGFSYGRIMNKQFLFAAFLGADYVHRRDSDVKVVPEFGFPSEIELQYLGKSVFEANQIIPDRADYNENKKIYMVGSGYSGGSDWKVDYSPFLPQDAKLILEFNKLAGYTENLSTEYYNEVVTGNISVTKKVNYLPKDNHPNPLCGNISYYKVFKHIPCSPIFSTIGSDNLIRDLLKNIDFPIIYHSNFVHHTFTADRKKDDVQYLESYWPRVVNKLDYYSTIRKYIFSNLKENTQKYIAIEDINASGLLENYIEDADFNAVKASLIQNFASILLKAENVLLRDLGGKFISTEFQERIIKNTTTGMKNHRKLIEAWDSLMKVAENGLSINIEELDSNAMIC